VNGPQDGIAYLLRLIGQLRHELRLARQEISRQRIRADLATLRLERATKPRRKKVNG
jgi:hypothetical protein